MSNRDMNKIIRYILDEMAAEEKAEFESRMEKDPQLRELHEEARRIYGHLEDVESLKLKMRIKKVMKDNPVPRARNIRNLPRSGHIWLAAMAIALVGLVAVIYMSVSAYFRVHDEENGLGKLNIFRKDVYYIAPVYNEMIKYETRSEHFHLLEPKDSAVFTTKSDVIFRWETDLMDPIYFEIMNRKGKVVYSSHEPVTSPYLVLQRQNRGAYIYRFRTQNHAIRYGLMFVE